MNSILKILFILLPYISYSQKVQKKTCTFYDAALVSLKDYETDTITIKAKYIGFGKLPPFSELDSLNNKGMLHKKDYLLAIQFKPVLCEKEYYMPVNTMHWKNATDIFSMKNSGKYFNYTCVFYKRFSEGRLPFFIVLGMKELTN